jgi:hypothetical protein
MVRAVRQSNKWESGAATDATRLYFSLDKKAQLFAQK